jgi:hypothetical protein
MISDGPVVFPQESGLARVVSENEQLRFMFLKVREILVIWSLVLSVCLELAVAA